MVSLICGLIFPGESRVSFPELSLLDGVDDDDDDDDNDDDDDDSGSLVLGLLTRFVVVL